MSKRIVKISVRNLVEFILKSGDLVAAFTSSVRAVDGSKIHRKIQKSHGSEYQPEVFLSIIIERDDVILQVSGRADGVIVTTDETGNKHVTIDEIKSTTRELELIDEDNNPLHWGQAMCYAHMYAVEHELNEISVQLTYCQAATYEIKAYTRKKSVQELAAFFNDLVTQYAKWAERLGDWLELRDESARSLEFPFASFRQGQRQLAVAAYKTIELGRKLYAQAPTGTGKTMATIFPAVKALGLGHVEKIFFLTAKTVTRQLAEEAFERLRRSGLKFKSLTLTAKDKICFMPETACTPEECPYAAGYYNRINQALADAWQCQSCTREVVEQYARDYKLCPFEFSLDLAFWADAIICDYNYVFDPRVYLKRFFAENTGQYCFLVDEAHNLVDRAREMFSAEINKKAFLGLRKTTKDKIPKLAKAAGKINSFFLTLKELCIESSAISQASYCVQKEALGDIYPLLRQFTSVADDWLATNEPAVFRQEVLDAYFAAHAFLRTAEMYDDRYVTYIEKEDKDVKLKLFCVNPSELLRQALTRGRASVLFSATLTPLNYFSEILGGDEEDAKLAVASPFSRDNLCLLVADNISTTYKMRNITYDAVVETITAAIRSKVGNYLVFLPSYQYMEEVYQRFVLKNPELKVVRQIGKMSEEERDVFLSQFSEHNGDTLVGFAVLGGVFGEGIDLVGERLVGAIIVGVGLPQVCLEREIIKNWFDEDNHQGFEYAYVYPGMNKVMQAAGRVIRTEKDRGVVLLIDDRFPQPRYRRLFPQEWQGAVSTKNTRSIAEKTAAFWAKE